LRKRLRKSSGLPLLKIQVGLDVLNYHEAVAYLETYINYEKLPNYRWTQAAFRLGRMFRILELAGNPQAAFPSVHVAGTKGKGSTCAFAASVLKAHGKKAGLYTSPHVLDLRERICIDGRWISRDEFAGVMSELAPCIRQAESEMIRTTYFEILTAAAMLFFARERVDAGVFEVGIGGRLDATNVLEPAVSVITSIGFDHTDRLGKTLPEIAYEKCGIIKPGVPVVSAPQVPEALETVERTCSERGSPLRLVGRDIVVCGDKDKSSALRFESETGACEVERLGIEGIRQRENAACAIGAVEELHKAGLVKLELGKVSAGLSGARLRARFEVIPGEPFLLLDGAHNADSLRALVDSFKAHPGLSHRWADAVSTGQGKVVAIVSLAADKDLPACLSILNEIAGEFVFTRSSNPRSADPARLLELLLEIGGKKGQVAEEIPQAFEAGQEAAGKKGVIIVTGSFYLAGDFASILLGTTEDGNNDRLSASGGE